MEREPFKCETSRRGARERELSDGLRTRPGQRDVTFHMRADYALYQPQLRLPQGSFALHLALGMERAQGTEATTFLNLDGWNRPGSRPLV